MKKIINFNEDVVKHELGKMVRGTVEEMLNNMLDAQADKLTNAGKYERTEARKDTRAGHYERNFETRVGKVKLKMPKLRQTRFETAIIERYQRRESSIEEALIEMYLAGVSVRRVEDITEALWGDKVSPGTISKLNQKAYGNIEEWRNRSITGTYPYVYLDGTYLKKSWGGEVTNTAVLVAIAVGENGFREVLGASEGCKEDKESWTAFLKGLKKRGLKGTQLFVTDKCLGLVEAIAEIFPKSRWQRCIVHFYRNILSVVPNSKTKDVAAMLKAIHAQEDLEAAKKKSKEVVEKLKTMKLKAAAEHVEAGIDETTTYMRFPREHWRRIRTTNGLERIMREIKRRTKVVGCFPDGKSALMLVCARLRHVAGSAWSSKRYLNMKLLKDQKLVRIA